MTPYCAHVLSAQAKCVPNERYTHSGRDVCVPLISQRAIRIGSHSADPTRKQTRTRPPVTASSSLFLFTSRTVHLCTFLLAFSHEEMELLVSTTDTLAIACFCSHWSRLTASETSSLKRFPGIRWGRISSLEPSVHLLLSWCYWKS